MALPNLAAGRSRRRRLPAAGPTRPSRPDACVRWASLEARRWIGRVTSPSSSKHGTPPDRSPRVDARPAGPSSVHVAGSEVAAGESPRRCRRMAGPVVQPRARTWLDRFGEAQRLIQVVDEKEGSPCIIGLPRGSQIFTEECGSTCSPGMLHASQPQSWGDTVTSRGRCGEHCVFT